MASDPGRLIRSAEDTHIQDSGCATNVERGSDGIGTWQVGLEELGLEELGLFMTWLAHAGPAASGVDAAVGAGTVLGGPGVPPARGARRINGVLSAVSSMMVHGVSTGQGPGHLVSLLYEVADDRDLPEAARSADGPMSWEPRPAVPHPAATGSRRPAGDVPLAAAGRTDPVGATPAHGVRRHPQSLDVGRPELPWRS